LRVAIEYLTVTLILLALVLTVLNTAYTSLNVFIESSWEHESQNIALNMLRDLRDTPGYPENWESNTSNVKVIGLASPNEPGKLSLDKLRAFNNMDDYEVYNVIMEIYGLRGFKIILRPAINIEQNVTLLNSNNIKVKLKVLDAISGNPLPNANLDLWVYGVEDKGNTTGIELNIVYHESTLTDWKGEYEKEISILNVDKLLVLSYTSYYGIKGMNFTFVGLSPSIASTYLNYTISSNILTLVYDSSKAPPQAAVIVSDTILIYDGEWTEYKWYHDNNVSGRLLNSGGKTTLNITLPNHSSLVLVPVSVVGIPSGREVSTYIVLYFEFDEDVFLKPIIKEYGMKGVLWTSSYTRGLAEVGGVTYSIEVYVSR